MCHFAFFFCTFSFGMVSYDNDTYNLLFCLLAPISYRFKLGRVSVCYTQSRVVNYILHNFWVNLMQERPNAVRVIYSYLCQI